MAFTPAVNGGALAKIRGRTPVEPPWNSVSRYPRASGFGSGR
jgi:hypothetical protein